MIAALIGASASIIVAIIGFFSARDKKHREAERIKEARRIEAEKLQLQMISANTSLTVGVAMALKHGKCNGEVEDGLKQVKDAQLEYRKFLEHIAIEDMN